MVALMRYKDVIATPKAIPAMQVIVSKLSEKNSCIADFCIVSDICHLCK